MMNSPAAKIFVAALLLCGVGLAGTGIFVYLVSENYTVRAEPVDVKFLTESDAQFSVMLHEMRGKIVVKNTSRFPIEIHEISNC